MKKLTTLMAAGLGLLIYNSANAQVGLRISLNLGGVAVHTVYNSAPVQYSSYDNNGDDYYYLPDVEAYYSVPQHCYYYNDGQRWVNSAYLPGRYHDYDWRAARHYEIRGDRPFMHHDLYRTRYGGFDQRGGGYADNRFDNRGGFDRDHASYDNHNYGRDNNNGYGQGWNNNHDRQFQGGFDRQDRMNRGQYQNGNNDQNRGGWNQGGTPNQNGGNIPQNGNGQSRGGQYQGGNANQPQNGGGMPNGAQGRSGQPANDGQSRRGGDYQNGNNDNHFAANKMGVIRPSRF